jgi:hypothetical protein
MVNYAHSRKNENLLDRSPYLIDGSRQKFDSVVTPLTRNK